ncbi:WecB/TagA/CpsF family glycosyltransferase [Bradyrhizobium sp. NP1]|uniref:WecB/TagA/CpsF family glycosyltransferase n=1 Tax=Bradyrhizobium sp. NP1 TaxID=3049772 RepID=UPI0025A631EE|nr:WecB/TagA/CpsF family glycosyltransferase [Bradyrhizobium sp. NP1]WJR78795.1 WecB/TagA/CpsF family glycosyltransferase [Bradyrhizobium sp. NP1]
MRIVHVVRQFYPAVGGFESFVYELATRQVSDGHLVRVVTLDRLFKGVHPGTLPARERVAGVEIVRIPFFGSSRYPIAPSVLKHLGDADIVHVHAIDFFFDFLAWTRPLHRKRLVVSTHGGFFHTSFAARLKRIYFSTVTRASMMWYHGVAAVSVADQSQFCRIRPRGLVCIENGANISKFENAASRDPVKSMIWIGRFSQNKRLDRLIHFFAALLRRDPDWRLTVAGRPWDFGVEQLQDWASAANIEHALTIVEAPDDAEIKRLVQGCSVVASSSDYEGFGIAPIEGMSAGLFPLLSDIAPFQRLVANSGVGTNLNFDEPGAAAADFLERWKEVSDNYSSMRKTAIDAASRYGWEHVSGRYQSLYADALGARRRTILDVPFFVGTQAEAVERIDAEYSQGKSTIVAFANANALNVASRNEKFCALLKRSLVMNDGIGVDAASRILFGSSFPQNLNGTDFTPYFFKNTRNNYRIFFLGSSSGVAERAARRLIEMCGRHQIAGCQNGYSRAGDAVAIRAKIIASGADVVLVAMGNPLQEMWLAENLDATGCRLGFGVGALFDFLAGEVSRAPPWVRAARVEWVYRLLLEPGRLWRRYILGNPIFLMRVVGQWWSGARV